MIQPRIEVLEAIERGQALKDTYEHGPDALMDLEAAKEPKIDFDTAIRAKQERIDVLYDLIDQEVTGLAHLLVARMCSRARDRQDAPLHIEVKEKPPTGSGFRAGDGSGIVRIFGTEAD